MNDLLYIFSWLIVAIGILAPMLAAIIAIVRFVRDSSKNMPRDWRDHYAPKCANCGYDLRESPDHCPECGRSLSAYDRTIVWHLQHLRTASSAGERLVRKAIVGVEAATARRGRLL